MACHVCITGLEAVLHRVAGSVESFDSTLRDLVAATQSDARSPGVGLATPQVGVGLQLSSDYLSRRWCADPALQGHPGTRRRAARGCNSAMSDVVVSDQLELVWDNDGVSAILRSPT